MDSPDAPHVRVGSFFSWTLTAATIAALIFAGLYVAVHGRDEMTRLAGGFELIVVCYISGVFMSAAWIRNHYRVLPIKREKDGDNNETT